MEATTAETPQETTEFETIEQPAENGEPVEEHLLTYLSRFADIRGDDYVDGLLIRWRCDRSGHDFEVMVANEEPELVVCGRCGHQWSVVS